MTVSSLNKATGSYRNFNVAIYARAYEVRDMADLDWLAARFDVMQRYLKVDRVYLETHRDTLIADEATIRAARQFFADRGVRTSGGITFTVMERNRFQTYCYTRPESRAKVKEIAEYTASLFDDFLLDDFFFTNCKCPACIEAKGDRTWTDYRLDLMAGAARDLVVGPAKAVNPDVHVTIKYPNWYPHFHALGFNLELQPAIFDGIYTGTETRDAVLSNQHLQPYESYQIVRYFEAIAPGRNGGGWVDPFGSSTADRYAEQLWLTAFSKAPEIMLFDFRSLQMPVQPSTACGVAGRPAYRAAQLGYRRGFRRDGEGAPPGRRLPGRGRHVGAGRGPRFRAGRRRRWRAGRAGGRCQLSALPRRGRGLPARLPGDARDPHRAAAHLPGRGRDRPADRGSQGRSRHRCQDLRALARRQERRRDLGALPRIAGR